METGSDTQRLAARVFRELLADLETVSMGPPGLAGTIPLGLNLPDSDLDIVLEIEEPHAARDRLGDAFDREADFRMHIREQDQAVVCAFTREGLPVEIFGRAEPVETQPAYRHMIVEERLLDLAGPRAREAILRMKADGIKTEPAFARCFGLAGDPYAVLYDLYDLYGLVGDASADELRALVAAAGYP